MFNLDRFIAAQKGSYSIALEEIKSGRKRSHWIWYIFPQIDGLGVSYMSKLYAIKSFDEAKAYCENELLNSHLREMTMELLKQNESATIILGSIDAKKVCSCMTLFDLVSPNDIYAEVLNKFYEEKRCHRTLNFIKMR